jgi:hypothetical protein
MQVQQVDTTKPRQVRQFLDLPFSLYRDVPQWVPPLASDARRMLDRRRHPFYQHSDAAFYLALDEDHRPCGRLAVLDNAHYNDYNRERTALFYLFECVDDSRAAQELFEAAFQWACSRGLNRIIGPKGLSALDGMGLLVQGFEHRPALGIPYNPPRYPALIEAAGFEPCGDVVSGYLHVSSPFPERIHQVAQLVQEHRGLRVARFRKRRDLRLLVPRLKDLYNAAIVGLPGNTPLTADESRTLANQMLWFADPRLIKIVLKGEEIIGFLFAYPDISAALQRTRGRLFPFGWIDLLLELRRTRWVNINGAGILPQHRGLGGTALLFSEIRKSIVGGGFEVAEVVQVGVENERMLRELRDLGVDFCKVHRLYQRGL